MIGTELRDAFQPFAHTVRPLMEIEDGSGRRLPVGTAVLVQSNAARYVLTAAHVVSGPTTKLIGVFEQDAIAWPRPYSLLKPMEGNLPDADLAWATATALPGDTALSPGLPMALALGNVPDAPGSAYIAVGFPGSRAKVRHPDGLLNSKMMIAVVERAPPAAASAVVKDARVQMALHYSQAGRTGLDGSPTVGAHPKGMSGGAVFAVLQATTPKGSIEFLPFLAGIVTEFHADIATLVATRVTHLWQAAGLGIPSLTPMLYRRESAS